MLFVIGCFLHFIILYSSFPYAFMSGLGFGMYDEKLFWEGFEICKINHLVRWTFVSLNLKKR